jgi:cell wall-associated NlpC family hydrolase
MGGKTGIDCSALMLRSHQPINYELPRTSWMQAEQGEPMPLDKIRPGDLVFFGHLNENKVSHVGLVTIVNSPKDVTFIHASIGQKAVAWATMPTKPTRTQKKNKNVSKSRKKRQIKKKRSA